MISIGEVVYQAILDSLADQFVASSVKFKALLALRVAQHKADQFELALRQVPKYSGRMSDGFMGVLCGGSWPNPSPDIKPVKDTITRVGCEDNGCSTNTRFPHSTRKTVESHCVAAVFLGAEHGFVGVP